MAADNLPRAMIETVTQATDWVIVLPLVLALFGAALLLVLRKARGLDFVFTMLTVGAIIACELSLLWRVYETGPISMTMGK